jgi:hypothetical protein
MSCGIDVYCKGQEVKDPLHLMSILEVRKVKNKGEELVWGNGDGYCDVKDDFNGRECDELESGVACVTMRDIMRV